MIIIGTAGTKEGRQLVSEQGVHDVFDHHKKGYLDDILRATGGKGVNIILEMLANENLSKDLSVLAGGGRVVVIGCRGPVEINPRDMMSRETSIIGMTVMSATEQQAARTYAALAKGLEDETIHPVIGRTFFLKQAAKAHAAVMQPGAYGKIILSP